MINLVTKNDERSVLKLFHGEESIELGFRLGKTLMVLGIDEEDDAGDFGD